MRNTSILTRVLALVLSVVLVLTGMPMAVFAEEIATPTELEQPEETTTATEDVVEEVPVTEEEQPAEEEAPAEGEAPVLDDSQLPADVVDELVPSDDPVEEAPEDLPTDDGEQVELPDQEEIPEENADEIPPVEDEIIAEDEPADDMPEEEELYFEDEIATEPEEITEDEHPVKVMVEASGYAYVMTDDAVSAYADPDLQEYMCSIAPGSALLVTAFIELDAMDVLEVQFMADACELAYVDAADLPEAVLTDDDLAILYQTAPFALILLDGMEAAVFAATVEYLIEDEQPVEVVPPVEDIPVEQPTEEDAVVEAPIEAPIEQLPEESGDELPEEDPLPVEDEELPGEVVVDPEGEILLPEDGELLPDASEEMTEDEQEPVDEVWVAQEGDFVLVSPDTRAFLSVDDTAAEDYEGDLAIGFFVNDAAVQVETVEQDSLDRWWYRITFMYGDDHADGTLKWTDFDTLYVLAEETEYTDAQDFDVTDYAFPFAPRAMTFSLRSTTAMNGFSLRDISASLGNFYAGQTGLHGSSGRDSEYLQIATMAGHGKIYATPHFLEGYVVYCLEHLLPGPGERVSGGSNQPTGPYAVVDLASYMNTPGYSGVMYKESTMHAIGWVLRHTVPFMELDRSDSDNRTWSRVAGQFAIREVIKQLEGSQYVRDYWQMEDFYAASGNAPAVYLEYARWLATNGIARGSMTGKITVSNKSVSSVNGRTVGTVKLTTDADLIRISKSYGTVTGNTYGEDGSYYYLNSGDTITITSTASAFSFKAESMSSPEEEAGFFVGVPQEAIQKLLIPIEGLPYPLKSVSVSFEIPYGSISVTKKDAASGAVLAGAVFDLMSGSTVIQTQTTGANGVVTFTNIAPGTYTIRERTAPQGYTLGSVNVQNVTVTNGQTSGVTFKNDKTTAKIKIRKTDQVTGSALAGATFTITRLSAPATDNGAGVGEVITITTNANGVAETGWLKWGKYKIEEAAAPDGYLNSGYSTVVECYENGKTYSFDVENEPMAGFIQIVKTNSLDDQPIAGVQFDIFHADGSGLAGSMTTNDEGVAISPPLRKGKYTVKEHANPEGYVAELVELQAEVRSKETTHLSAENKPIQGKIRIVKKDQLTGNMLAGAEFTITRISGLPSHNGARNGEVVAVITTDKNGVAESPLLTYGVYKVEETKAPEHFVNAGFSTEVCINEDNLQTYEISVENEPTKGWIKLTKADALDGHTIEGVRFDIYFAGSTELAGSMTTDANGVAVSPALPKGKYTVKEHANPEGYVAELVELEAVVSSDETTELEATNQPIQGKIRIVKKDQLTGDALTGAEFTISRVSGLPSCNGVGNGEVVAVITTGENGVAESPLLTYGVYKVEETVVPEHFVDNGFSVDVTIADDNLKTYEVVVENEPTKGWIRLTKTNSLDSHPIAGVQFNIYYYDEFGSGLAASMVTDENGVATSPALRKGKYLVQEVDEATGYVSDLVELTAMVESDETTYLSVTNQPIQGVLRIRKLDELTGEALAGAEFTITRISGLPSHNGDGDGEVVAVITSDAEGVAVSPLLTYGLYKVEETKVPEHFVDKGFSTEMVINEENFCTYEITVENEPTKGWISLTKTDRRNGNPIAGVVFDVYYNDQYGSGLATTIVTDENGIAMTEPLRKGKYIVQERNSTAGYVFEEILLDATVHSDETTKLAVTNQPVMVKLKLYKRDVNEYDGDPAAVPSTRGDGVLTGAEFQVLAAENILDRQGNVVHSKGDVVVPSLLTAGADASVTTDDLWPGKYEVIELTPPKGYQPAKGSIIVDARSAAKQSEEAVVTYEGVIKNEILYGAQAIVKILGEHTVEADPTRVETPEKGAEFRVYLKAAGSYENARKFERDVLKTDKNGYAKTKALPYGVYVLEQTKGKDGYEIKGPITFEIDGTESLVNPPPLTLSDKPILYRLKFIKTDSETGKTIILSNTTFKLKDAAGEYVKQKVFYPREQVIDTFTTDETGSVTLPETVTWGLYTIEEVKSPEGYLIRTEDFSVFVGNNGDQPGQTYELEIEIPNDPVKGRILLDKTGLQLVGFKKTKDAWGNEVHTPEYEEGYLAGAVFEVRAAETITGKDGTVWFQQGEVVDTITTTEQGGDASKELPLGKYELVEIKAPEGYFFNPAPIPVDLAYANDHTAVVELRVEVGNDCLPAKISLMKEIDELRTISSGKNGVKSILNTAPGEGFVFGLFRTHDMPFAYGTLMADTLVATGSTDRNGMLTFEGIYPHGDYYVKELQAKAGWKMSADRYDLSITPDRKASDENVLRVILVDPIHNDLVHGRVTLTKTDITGEKTLPGAMIEVYNDKGEVVYRDTTDEHGRIASIPVTPGRYTFREIYAPDGYALNDAIMSFTVDGDGVVTGTTTIRDDYTRFSIAKCDENEAPLSGVEFSLIRSDGSTLMTVRTNRSGIATFEKVPHGSYRIVETRPLAGYLPAEMDVQVNVDGTFLNPEEPLAVIVNVPNEVLIQKVDQDGKPLSGAEFALIDAFGDRFAVATSDANGQVRFHKVPYGSYTIRELKAPDGYLASKEEITLKVDANFRSTGTPVATVINHQKRVKFIKVDTSGKFLPGVEFSLLNAVTYEVVETVTSNEKGEFIFTQFDYGDWIIRETAAPDGYSRMEDYLLHVGADWTEPDPITLINIPSTYMFFKSDNRRNALAGVTFVVEDEKGKVVQEVVSGEDGVVYIYGLMPGKYTIRETATVEGFAVSDDTIEIVIDEKYTVPTKLKRFVNYPSIATGVDVSPTTLTWIGVGLSGAAGVILLLGRRKRKAAAPKRK